MDKSLLLSSHHHLGIQINRFLDGVGTDTRINYDELNRVLNERLNSFSNPNIERFFSALLALPNVDNVSVLIGDEVTAKFKLDSHQLHHSLLLLRPWRKGPFKLSTVKIDAEWQSHLKWNRFQDYFSLLKDKRILDIGCGNGYYMYRMLAHDPKLVLGIDPSDLTYFQFHAVHSYISDPRLYYLPIGWGDLHPFCSFFDVVFCMGVMYHHRSPVDLFKTIRSVSKDNTTLFFDTLIIDGDDETALFPRQRYAQMPNVYFIPTLPCLKNILSRAGFNNITVLSIDKTSINEQRSTLWTFEKSLVDFLDPTDLNKTIEGYPAPCRIALVAEPK